MGGGGEFSRRRPDGSGGKGDLSSIPRTHTEGKNYFKRLFSDPHAHKLIIHKDKGEKRQRFPLLPNIQNPFTLAKAPEMRLKEKHTSLITRKQLMDRKDPRGETGWRTGD